MMRLEERISKALKQVDNDRYVLAIAVGQRADELSKGAKPLLELIETHILNKYSELKNQIHSLTGGYKIDHAVLLISLWPCFWKSQNAVSMAMTIAQ